MSWDVAYSGGCGTSSGLDYAFALSLWRTISSTGEAGPWQNNTGNVYLRGLGACNWASGEFRWHFDDAATTTAPYVELKVCLNNDFTYHGNDPSYSCAVEVGERARTTTLFADPTEANSLTLDVNEWHRAGAGDPASYDLDFDLEGGARTSGPCDGTSCNWSVEAWDLNSNTQTPVATLASGSLSSGTSSYARNLIGSLAGGVTHLKATVSPQTTDYRQTYTTGFIAVSDEMSAISTSLPTRLS